MKKKIIYVLIAIVALAFLGYNYMYQDHRDISTEKAAFTLTSASFFNEFESDSEKAQTKYLNQTLELSGVVTALDETSITLDNTIFCSLNGNQKNTHQLNTKITVKGRFIGYDDLLEEIKLDQTTILKP